MKQPKDILVITAPILDGITIKKYLKPVTAHIVAGTNMFSDLAASLSDVFGGRSSTYQKQITAIYNEAIQAIKYSAFEIGGNCVLDLKIDVDEISGKGKSMFMLTAIGTAVMVEESEEEKLKTGSNGNLVSLEDIENARYKKEIFKKAADSTLAYDASFWSFVTSNQVYDAFEIMISKLERMLTFFGDGDEEKANNFINNIITYLNSFPEETKLDMVYSALQHAKTEALSHRLLLIIYKLNLFDFSRLEQLLNNSDIDAQRKALAVAVYNKPYYTATDINNFDLLKKHIQVNFTERGTRTTKKGFLGSKEKEIWICECGEENNGEGNEIEFCERCKRNIFGFKTGDVTPTKALKLITEKVELIKELL